MKKATIALTFIAGLLMAACRGNCYRIEGESALSGLEGHWLYLKLPQQDEWVDVDSCEVVHGRFRMSGQTDTARLALLYMDHESIIPFVLEPGHIVINFNEARVTLSGTDNNCRLNDFYCRQVQLSNMIEETSHNESQLIMTGTAQPSTLQRLQAKRDSLTMARHDHLCDFIIDNSCNILGRSVFLICGWQMPRPKITPQMQRVLKAVPSEFLADPAIDRFLTAARDNGAY